MPDDESPAAVATPPSETVVVESPALAFFQSEGKLEIAGGNRPFLLYGVENVWFVESGNIEAFTVQVKDGEPIGARAHFLTVKTGEVMFGMDLERYGQGHGFLAVGLTGTRLWHLPRSRFEQVAADPQWSEYLAPLLDSWISALSVGVTKDITPRPKVDVHLAEEGESAIKKGQKIHAKKGITWIELREAEGLFIGMQELFFETEPPLFPLTTETWFEPYNDHRVQCMTTRTALGNPAIWRGLDYFHETLCQCEFINKRLVAVDEFNRLRTKADYRRVAKEAALTDIASVMDETAGTQKTEADGSGDPLLTVCRLVGESLGITMRPHPEAGKEGKKMDPLGAIVKASRIRSRTVALRGEWWKHDHGALLAYIGSTKQPVAILPTGPGSYEFANPQVGLRNKLTPEVAATFDPFAYSFYRPFPDGLLKGVDLVKFGARGLTGDFKMIVVMGVVTGVLGTFTPWFTGQIFDQVIPGAERSQLFQFTMGLIFAALATATFQITRAIAVLRVEGKMDYSIQAALWDRLLNLPSTFFRDYSAGDLADRAEGIDSIRAAISGVGVSAVLGSMTSVFYLIMLFKYNMKLAFTAFGLVVVAVIVTSAANFAQVRHQRKQYAIRGKISGLVLQLITGVNKLRVAGAEDHAFKVWAKGFSEQKRVAFQVGRIANFLAVFNTGYPVLTSITIFFVMFALKAVSDASGGDFKMSTGDFLAFNTAFGAFLAAMLALSSASLSILSIVPMYERLKPIINTPPEIDDAKSYPGELMGEIEVFHVNFRYKPDGPLILKNVELKIKAGEFIAFVGGSGSGKSTLLRLLLGFEKPEAGNVYFDGQDLATLDLREVRQQMGVVLQTSRLVPTEIYRNIVGALPLTIDDAWEAARMAGLEEDIKNMPMGMHTVVSEGGGTFSGGQRQRLMIARAIVNRPRILFFDEATSALDNRTQKIVTDSLDAMHATRIVVAHRLSTIINADRIIVLEQGRIVEEGSYKDLLERGGHFAELAKRQIA
ncbi:MAG: NHLP bacteriocin export ABC transporter permease/ATPase subunit [Chthoniobacter sp.]|uniref:NHLP bacteriocin export ABC transporter permease/ATPase subunit n=1 Tax=Chthoniobacter sp. TaxID=2510640 RepID=UPI0032A7A5B4